MLTAKQIQDFLKLQPLPVEGGYFVESYRSKFTLVQPSLPPGYPGERVLSTAIYYMLTPDTFSAMHRLKGDEVYHFYLGDPVEMLMLKPDGTAEARAAGTRHPGGDAPAARGSGRYVARLATRSRRQIRADGHDHGPRLRPAGLRAWQARRFERSIPELRPADRFPDAMNFKAFDLPAAHIFKIRSGKIHEIEAMGTMMPYNSRTGWE